MPRPASVNDLPSYVRSGEALITVQLTQLAVSSKVLAAAAALLAAVEKTPGVSTVQEHGTITVSKDKTPEELASSVRAYQGEWDATQKNFLSWQENGVPNGLTPYAIGNVLTWATRENVTEDETGFLRAAIRDAKIREATK